MATAPAKPRNRRKLKARAAAWKARKEDAYFVAVSKRLYGVNILMGATREQPVGLLSGRR